MMPIELEAIHEAAVGRQPTEETPFNAGEKLAVWTAILLREHNVGSQDAQRALLREMRQTIIETGNKVAELGTYRPSDGSLQVVVADNRYVTWSGQMSFFDLHTGRKLSKLPQPTLQSTAYNLVELLRRKMTASAQSG